MASKIFTVAIVVFASVASSTSFELGNFGLQQSGSIGGEHGHGSAGSTGHGDGSLAGSLNLNLQHDRSANQNNEQTAGSSSATRQSDQSARDTGSTVSQGANSGLLNGGGKLLDSIGAVGNAVSSPLSGLVNGLVNGGSQQAGQSKHSHGSSSSEVGQTGQLGSSENSAVVGKQERPTSQLEQSSTGKSGSTKERKGTSGLAGSVGEGWNSNGHAANDIEGPSSGLSNGNSNVVPQQLGRPNGSSTRISSSTSQSDQLTSNSDSIIGQEGSPEQYGSFSDGQNSIGDTGNDIRRSSTGLSDGKINGVAAGSPHATSTQHDYSANQNHANTWGSSSTSQSDQSTGSSGSVGTTDYHQSELSALSQSRHDDLIRKCLVETGLSSSDLRALETVIQHLLNNSSRVNCERISNSSSRSIMQRITADVMKSMSQERSNLCSVSKIHTKY